MKIIFLLLLSANTWAGTGPTGPLCSKLATQILNSWDLSGQGDATESYESCSNPGSDPIYIQRTDCDHEKKQIKSSGNPPFIYMPSSVNAQISGNTYKIAIILEVKQPDNSFQPVTVNYSFQTTGTYCTLSTSPDTAVGVQQGSGVPALYNYSQCWLISKSASSDPVTAQACGMILANFSKPLALKTIIPTDSAVSNSGSTPPAPAPTLQTPSTTPQKNGEGVQPAI